jgi:hypothetical protein
MNQEQDKNEDIKSWQARWGLDEATAKRHLEQLQNIRRFQAEVGTSVILETLTDGDLKHIQADIKGEDPKTRELQLRIVIERFRAICEYVEDKCYRAIKEINSRYHDAALQTAEEYYENVCRCRFCGKMEVILSDDPNRKQHVSAEDDGLCPGPRDEQNT